MLDPPIPDASPSEQTAGRLWWNVWGKAGGRGDHLTCWSPELPNPMKSVFLKNL